MGGTGDIRERLIEAATTIGVIAQMMVRPLHDNDAVRAACNLAAMPTCFWPVEELRLEMVEAYRQAGVS